MARDASLLLPSVLWTHFQLLAVLADCPEWSPCPEISLLQRKRDSEPFPVLPRWGERPSSDLSAEPKAWPFAEFGATLMGYLGSRVSWKVLAVRAPYLNTLPYQVPLIHLVTAIPTKLSPWVLSRTFYLHSFSYSLVYTAWYTGNKNLETSLQSHKYLEKIEIRKIIFLLSDFVRCFIYSEMVKILILLFPTSVLTDFWLCS